MDRWGNGLLDCWNPKEFIASAIHQSTTPF